MQHAILDAADELDLPAFTVPAPTRASARVTSAIARPVRDAPPPPPAVPLDDGYAPDDHAPHDWDLDDLNPEPWPPTTPTPSTVLTRPGRSSP